MAAGRHNVSGRRYSHRSNKEISLYENGYYVKNWSRGHDYFVAKHDIINQSSIHTVNSGGKSHSHRKRNGFVDVTVKEEHGYLYSGRTPSDANDVESWVGDKEIQMSESEPYTRSEKKRKFSPIIWDRDEKKVRFSSRNRIKQTSGLASLRSGLKSSTKFDQLLDLVTAVKTEGCSTDGDRIPDLQVSPVEPPLSVSSLADITTIFSPNRCRNDDQELGEMEKGEYIKERSISKSRWAYMDTPRTISDQDSSSPESGEVIQEGSKGSRDKSSTLAKAGHGTETAGRDKKSENELEIDDKVASIGLQGITPDDNDDFYGIQLAEVPDYGRFNMLQGCRSKVEFEMLDKINEGTYGVVYKARDKKTGEFVALKKVKMEKEREGFPVSALREINILMSLQHPSILKVKEVIMDDFDGVYMVMDYMDHELKAFMKDMKQPFSQSEVKYLMTQLLEGLSYLHDNGVLHRDLKTSNLLLNNKGELKICDFGMSRPYGSQLLSRHYGLPLRSYTSLVVTLWYRAPELLLGTKDYSTAIDMWSVGCIMAELLAKKPLFDGQTELQQMDKIFSTLGTPSETNWPGFSKLRGSKAKAKFSEQPYNHLRQRFPAAAFTGSPVLTELGFDLLNKLLTYDPKQRIKAEDALNHGWFREIPLPAQHIQNL